jgi:DNA-binding response OmpR family regulator
MHRFGWISDQGEPCGRWDLRLLGWQLCASGADNDSGAPWPLLCDYRNTSPVCLAGLKGLRRQTVLLGVDGSLERAGLLAAEFADVLPSDVDLRELAQRARRIAATGDSMPRYLAAGPVRLDLFHRDASVAGRWLGLHPREFALLWQLAERPGKRISRRQLLADVWRLQHEPETNRVEVHVSRLRGKLATAGLQAIVATDPRGGYHLALDAP